MSKSNVYSLIGLSQIEVRDSKTQARLQPGGEFEIPLLGSGFLDGVRETLCIDEFESSIWLKDHQVKDVKKKTIKTVLFKGGTLKIPKENTREIEMISKWAKNRNNITPDKFIGEKPLFEFIDTEAIAEEGMKKEEFFTKAKNYCFTAPQKKIEQFAQYKDIDVSDYSLKELRYMLSTKFNQNTAELFVKEFESDQVEVKFKLKVAFDMGDIAIDDLSKKIVWGDSKKIITSFIGDNAIDSLLRYCYTPEGKVFYHTLTSESVSEISVEASAKPSAASVETSEDIDISILELVDIGIEQGFIEEKANEMFYFDGARCGKGKQKVASHFANKAEKLEKLKDKIGA